ncbi:MAG: hypothetical protein ACRERU_21625 [Methylococcales bacterium]
MLNDLGGYFEAGDRAFLSDGWGDLIIVLSGDPDERLSNIFKIQRVLYEDFQVERTELMLTPRCVRTAALNKNEFYIRVLARLLNNRTLASDNADFVKSVQENFTYSGVNPSNYTLALIPGLSDYDWKFEPGADCNVANSLYEKILKGFLTGRSVDRVQRIGKINGLFS